MNSSIEQWRWSSSLDPDAPSAASIVAKSASIDAAALVKSEFAAGCRKPERPERPCCMLLSRETATARPVAGRQRVS
jgi:hypothetical protein